MGRQPGPQAVSRRVSQTRMADKEAHAGRIVAEAGVGAPPMGDVVVVAGRRGIVFGRIDGESMLARLQRRPWSVVGLARTLGRLHAKMHSVARPQLPAVRAALRRDIERTSELTPQCVRQYWHALTTCRTARLCVTATFILTMLF